MTRYNVVVILKNACVLSFQADDYRDVCLKLKRKLPDPFCGIRADDPCFLGLVNGPGEVSQYTVGELVREVS